MTEVKLPLASAKALGVAWGVGNQLMTFPCQKPRVAKSSQSSGLGTPTANLINVCWETTLYDPVFRKLVNESSQTFFALQKLAQEQSVISNDHLVRISRQYRSVIRDCQLLLDKGLESGQDENGPVSPGRISTLTQQSELLYKLELIWNLEEVLLIEKHTAGIILPQLLQWITMHFPQADEKTRRILEEYPENPEVHQDYWDAIALFLTQARKDQARNLLRLHSEFGADPGDSFESLDELIKKMPLFNNQMSVVDFNFRWKHWQNEVIARQVFNTFLCPERWILII
jgi:hypothetical protein